jgi:acyl CoA:acetate/3-ketoacid CoA transferase alpha subunit/acyl CoA:acetate/3-ketoacid CoA transferase beta subunit
VADLTVQEETSQLLEKYFKPELMEGESKVKPLDEAIREYIKPEMHIYFAYLPFTLTYEVIRQFKDRKSDFTVSCLGGVENIMIMASAGLVRRVITSYIGSILPSPTLSGALQQAISNGMIIENWSLLTMVQRLQAAALNLPFMATRSLENTSIAEENKERGLYKRIIDPFTEEEIGIVKPLRPDITLMHAYCADSAGNAIPVLPYTEEAYGAFASKEGVILSVEKIVDTQYLRKNAFNVKVPASVVKCVVEAPFGMHPHGCRGPDGHGYGEDVEFAGELQKALRDSETAKKWIKEWIIDVKSHREYLHKLTSERLQRLRERITYENWKIDGAKIIERLPDAPANRVERATIFAAREVVESLKRHKYDSILAGIGISHFAAWMAMYTLRLNRVNVQLIVELGLYGYFPPPTQPFLISTRGMESCLMLTDTLNILGLVANNARVLACISAGQIDKNGNINSTKIGGFFLFGSGGASDISTTAKEVIVTLLHDKRRLMEEVPYITCSGRNVKKVVTDRAVFEKEEDELILKKVYVEPGENKEDALSVIRENMGWNPKISDNLMIIDEPRREEILMLRCFDPDRYFLGKLKADTSGKF